MDSLDLSILFAISGDMELTANPFQAVAEEVGVSEEVVLKRVRSLSEAGIIKRVAPILYHQKAKYRFNALSIWSVDESQVEDVANYLMSFQHISHVYERETSPAWPYNLYGMIHAKSPEEIDAIVSKICSKTGDVPHKIVYTVKEWKKTSPDLKYLLGGIEAIE